VRIELAQRAAALAAAALLAGVFGVALSQAGQDDAKPVAPQPAVGAWGGWEDALVGVAAPIPRRGRRSDCGWFLNRGTLGVFHPVLPCGARIFLDYGGREVLTRVVARSPVGENHEFDLTRALALRVGLDGERELRWTYAR
jgi:hypothetical protein